MSAPQDGVERYVTSRNLSPKDRALLYTCLTELKTCCTYSPLSLKRVFKQKKWWKRESFNCWLSVKIFFFLFPSELFNHTWNHLKTIIQLMYVLMRVCMFVQIKEVSLVYYQACCYNALKCLYNAIRQWNFFVVSMYSPLSCFVLVSLAVEWSSFLSEHWLRGLCVCVYPKPPLPLVLL